MRTSGFAALTLFAVIALAMPAAASELTIDSVLAVQYPYPYFFVKIDAHGPLPPTDAHLLADGVPVVPDGREYYTFTDGTTHWAVWKFFKWAENVVRPGSTLTVVVTDSGLNIAEKQVPCAAKDSNVKRKSGTTTVCW